MRLPAAPPRSALPSCRPFSCPYLARSSVSRLSAVRPLAAASSEQAVSGTQFAAARRALSAAIDCAVKREDYAVAASLQRELQAINNADPFFALNQQLESSIREERFQDAARLKAQLAALESSLGPAPADVDMSLKTHSDTVTQGIRIRIQSTYRAGESTPQLSQYFFSYHVCITNESDQIVQLRQRHWVHPGPGVIGVQPILLPGKQFEYDSACPIRTPTGTMEGEFEFWLWNEKDGEFGGKFDAKIGRFKLSSKDS